MTKPDTLPNNGRAFAMPNLGRSVAWLPPDMTVLQEGRAPAPLFPTEIFGPIWSQWLSEAAEDKGAPVDYPAGALLVAASALIGNTRWVTAWPDRKGAWKEPPVLWGGLVGAPSSSKSPGADAVLELLAALDDELSEDFPETQRAYDTAKESAIQYKKKWESEVADAIKLGNPAPSRPVLADDPPLPVRLRIRAMDTTQEAMAAILAVNPRGLLSQRDELAGWLSSFGRYNAGGADRAFAIESYGGRPYIVDRKSRNGEPLRIPYLSVSVLGGVQPDRLHECLLDTTDDGLSSRFLWFWPDPVPPQRPRGSDETGQAALARLRRLLALKMGKGFPHGEPCPILVPLDAKASDLLSLFRDRIFNATNATNGLYSTALGKMPGQVIRLSLILEFLWWTARENGDEPTEVSAAAITAAADFIEGYAMPMARRVFGTAALPEQERLASSLAKHLKARQATRINRRDLYRSRERPVDINSFEKADLAIKGLVEANWLRPIGGKEEAGRPRSDYDVNPMAFAEP